MSERNHLTAKNATVITASVSLGAKIDETHNAPEQFA